MILHQYSNAERARMLLQSGNAALLICEKTPGGILLEVQSSTTAGHECRNEKTSYFCRIF